MHKLGELVPTERSIINFIDFKCKKIEDSRLADLGLQHSNIAYYVLTRIARERREGV